MNTTSWIVWGLGLTCAAGMIHSAGPETTEPMAATYAAMPALIVGAAGQFCLWRGLRSGMGDLWGGLTARKYRPGEAGKTSRSTSDHADEGEALSDFDADAAFARYMEKRAAGEQDEDATAPKPDPVRPSPAVPSRSLAARSFGRKTV